MQHMKLTAERIAEIIRHPETVHVECKCLFVYDDEDELPQNCPKTAPKLPQ